ncbi:conjugative transfer system coupling protein TraD [Neiella marina]|uniref:Conjugative transfer system coupling protein TraD n=1 Tax=Neiella holothuriorum TaxID=2870530 RepID=A0ABS7EGD0_9GAMM|nr:conjugative transfer system coupling protein TraD [Neiella holothuriorum]MBW8191380.1 conjugative transfer system coupling protein TraD [Neiella holothuriorum]
MNKLRKDPTFQENLFRPIYEVNALYGWAAASAATLASVGMAQAGQFSMQLLSASICTAMAGVRYRQAYPLLRRQLRLFTNKIDFMPAEKLRKLNQVEVNILQDGEVDAAGRVVKHSPDDRETYLCEGFEWGPEHANRAHQVIDLSSDYGEVKLPLIMRPWEKRLRKTTRRLGGKPWIHGMGESKRIMVSEDAWYGHTFMAGNVGTGKTTLLKLLSLSMYHLGHTLIIIDPKNDREWRESIENEMASRGEAHKFHYFHPSIPSESIRLQPLKNFNRHTEITTRVAALQATGDGPTSFSEFGWEVINKAVEGSLFIGEQPRLTTLQSYLTDGKSELCIKCLEKHFDAVLGEPNWRITLQKEFEKRGKSTLEQYINYYLQVVAETHKEGVVDKVISLITHDAAHYQKMVVGLLPLFSILNAKPLDELISPVDDLTGADKRPIIDTKQIIEGGGVLYLALDSLSDSKTAGHLAKLILSDIAAAAGERYNYGGSGRRVSIFVDEVHAAVAGNDALLNLLAQGRAAAMQCFLATQTIPDLEAKTDPASAERFLGLCNNFISMRVNDQRTQEYVCRNFGRTSVLNTQISMSENTNTTAGLGEFAGGYSERLNRMKDDSFPEQLLTDLPKLQFIARLADGRKVKGRIPVIKE